MRTSLAILAAAAVGLLSAGTASARTQAVQTAGRAAADGTLAAAASAVPGAGAAPTISATAQLAERRFVAAGTDAYVVGVENGTFPPIGWHTTGQMGGVWTPPVKLLDGLWFGRRTMPSSDRSDGGADASASCSPVSPAHLHSRVERCQFRKPSRMPRSGPVNGSSIRVTSGAVQLTHLMLAD